MTHTARYVRLRPRLVAIAHKRSYGDHSMADEMLSVADLAFWQACLDRDKARIRLDDFVILRCQNAMSNFRRVNRRYQRRYVLMGNDRLENKPCPHSMPASLDLVSEDAKTVAWAIVTYGMKDAKRKLYRLIGWDRVWNAIDEIREALAS